MNKRVRKHNMKVYTESVMDAKRTGGYYVMGTGDGRPLPESTVYLMGLAKQKMKRNEARTS